jgi:hypothetical protein
MFYKKSNTTVNNHSKLRSALALGGIISVFIAVFLVNERAVNEMDMSSSVDRRGIASTHPTGTFDRDNSWQKKLATQIAGMNEMPAGKSARRPNAIEKFLFGELKGYYLMELKNQKVHEMLLKQREADDLPRYVGEELNFLQKNRELWWIGFSSLEVKERNNERSVVRMLDSAQRVVGEAAFTWDVAGRLLSLKLEKQ